MALKQSRLQAIIQELLVVAILLAMVGLVFWQYITTNLILPRGDTFTYFYPYWQYRNEILRMGMLPMWNPYLFMGAPFLANSQAGVLYPLNWIVLFLDAPEAIKASIILHAMIAAIGQYILSRRLLHLNYPGSMASAITFVLGGYVLAQIEHVNQFQGLAWLPWIFWLWGEILELKSYRAVPALSMVFALQLLAGHSQTAFITGTGLGLWTLWEVSSQWRVNITRIDLKSLFQLARQFILPARLLITAVALATGLAAAQLLPTLELTSLSNRSGGLPFIEALSFSFRPTLLGRAFLPQYTDVALFSEFVAYPGIVSLILAIAAISRNRKERAVQGMIFLAAAGLLLALGGYNPAYWALVKVVPGFRLFRVPARWLALTAFACAGLAGTGLNNLSILKTLSWRRELWGIALVVVLAGLAFLASLEANEVPGASAPSTLELAGWLITILTLVGVIYLASRSSWTSQRLPLIVLGLLFIELLAASLSLPFNDLSTPALWSSQRPTITTLLAAQNHNPIVGRFLSLSDTFFDPGDLPELKAIYGKFLSEQQLYDYIVAIKQKEILAPNLSMRWHLSAIDGFDGGILPTRDFTRFTGYFVPPERLSPDGRLRENLDSVPPLDWLRLASVKWIITDKVFDVWVDGVYYDLQFGTTLGRNNNNSAIGELNNPFAATAIGLIGHIDTANLPSGTQIGTLALYASDNPDEKPITVIPLLIDSIYHNSITIFGTENSKELGSFTPDHPDIVEYHTLIRLDTPALIQRIEIAPVAKFAGTFTVRGLALIDERMPAFNTLTLTENNAISTIQSGDTKIYEMADTRPRAYLDCNPVVVKSEEDAWRVLPQIVRDNSNVIVDPAPPTPMPCGSDPGAVKFEQYEAENIRLMTESRFAAYLILSDTWYPGWEAWVDGQPTAIKKANGLFRAIWLPKGNHTVEFKYRNRGFETGALITLAALMVSLGWLLIPQPLFAKISARLSQR
jgi:hypothetical protein